jgi:hypothetical protein
MVLMVVGMLFKAVIRGYKRLCGAFMLYDFAIWGYSGAMWGFYYLCRIFLCFCFFVYKKHYK